MYSFLNACIDVLFPLSLDARCIRDTPEATFIAQCAPHTFGDVTALTSYRAPLVRAFIHEAKFRHNTRAIAFLGRLLALYIQNTYPPDAYLDTHFIVMPLSAERLCERGYNQVLEIARSAGTHLPNLHIHDTLLTKTQHTIPQTSLTRKERLTNLHGVFAINEHLLAENVLSKNTHLILFDDITTTGATLAEASRTLRNAGFTHITQLALAH